MQPLNSKEKEKNLKYDQREKNSFLKWINIWLLVDVSSTTMGTDDTSNSSHILRENNLYLEFITSRIIILVWRKNRHFQYMQKKDIFFHLKKLPKDIH